MSASTRQPDLFATTADLAEPPPTVDPAHMAETVRPRLARLLAEIRAATRMPWDEQRAGVNALIFHNMANWLPAPERDALRAAFRAELRRLGVEDGSARR